jgi:hypothetical protein
MALIVEDGTGLANAESYASVAEFKTYHTNIGNDVTLITDTTIEQLLRRATQYMVAVYRQRWQGRRTLSTQALDFPRYDVVVEGYSVLSNIVPLEVKNACCELSLKASSATLLEDKTQTVIREKVDVIEVEYDKNSPVQTRYSQIDNLLSVFLSSSNSFEAKTVRA